MCTYKEPISYIQQSVQSILRQTYEDLECIIVVDEPNNVELISYLEQLTEQDKRIVLHINEKNIGLTASLNQAKRIAKGEFVARMDADDISELDRLETQLAYLKENNCDLVGCSVRDIDENGFFRSLHATTFPTKDESIKRYLRTNDPIPHPTWFARRWVYDRFDYVDFPACEDYEFLVRIALAGMRLGNVKEPKLRYRINQAGISANKKVIQKTSLYYIRKNYKAGKVSSIDSFYQYLNSAEGQRKQKALTEYYCMSSKLKEYRNEHKMLSFLASGVFTFIKLPEAKNVVCSTIKERLLRYRCGKNY